jgi:hypothetical protein
VSRPPEPADRSVRNVQILMIVSTALSVVTAAGGLVLFVIVSFDGWSPVQLVLLGGSLLLISGVIVSVRELRKLRATGRR